MEATRPARWNWSRIALAASLLVNLFLVALIGGHWLRSGGGAADSQTPLARALARAEATLPPRDAAAFGAVIRRDAPRYEAAALRLREARRELGLQIAAEPFNQDGVRQALATWRTTWNSFFDDFSGTLVEALAQVSPQGRRKLVAERQAARDGLSPP
ncbi:MAG TPA: periplasmic heavy metal sensor [Acetobacteraceae bacterium]|nr:periplasmic heavy metal sensor [Acetobacteraceae bacterium]